MLVFANSEEKSDVSGFEEKLEALSLRVTKELVLLHPATRENPVNTRRWLEKRSWMLAHYHLKLPERLAVRRSERRLAEHYARLRDEGVKPDVHSDFCRLARVIRGTR